MPRSKDVGDTELKEAVEEWPKSGRLPSTGNIRDQVNEKYDADYDRKTVYRRLDTLVSEGLIRKIPVGAQERGRSIGWAPVDFSFDDLESPTALEEAPNPFTVIEGVLLAMGIVVGFFFISSSTGLVAAYEVGRLLVLATAFVGSVFLSIVVLVILFAAVLKSIKSVSNLSPIEILPNGLLVRVFAKRGWI